METKIFLYVENSSQIELDVLSKAVYSVTRQVDELSAEVLFVSKEEIKRLNKENRNIDSVTDVLSFPTLDGIRNKAVLKSDFPLDIDDDDRVFLGSIVVCEERAKEQALEYGHSEKREITYLICHGLLHLLGYDHMTDSDKVEMRKLEDKIMDLIKVYR